MTGRGTRWPARCHGLGHVWPVVRDGAGLSRLLSTGLVFPGPVVRLDRSPRLRGQRWPLLRHGRPVRLRVEPDELLGGQRVHDPPQPERAMPPVHISQGWQLVYIVVCARIRRRQLERVFRPRAQPRTTAETATGLVPAGIVAGLHATVLADGKLGPYSKEHDLTSEPSGLTVPFSVAPVSVMPPGASMRTFGFGMGAFVVSNVSVEDSLVPPLFVAVTLNVYFVPTLSPVTTAETATGLVPAGIVAGLHAAVLPDGRLCPYSNEHDFTSEPSGLTVPFNVAPVSVTLPGASTRTLGFALVVSNVSGEDSLVPPPFVAVSLKEYFAPAVRPVTTAETATGLVPAAIVAGLHAAVLPDGRLSPYSNEHDLTSEPSGLTVPFNVAPVSVTLPGASTSGVGFGPGVVNVVVVDSVVPFPFVAVSFAL